MGWGTSFWDKRFRAAVHWRFGAWLSLVERLVRDQEAGGSNPLAPTNSFKNLQVVAGQTAHPVAKLPSHPFVPILRAWRRTQPRIPPRRLLLPTDPPLLALQSLPSS